MIVMVNLKLSTNTLTFSNSTNRVYDSNNAFEIDANIGVSKNQEESKPNTTELNVNSSNITVNNSKTQSKSKTLATVGKGELTVADEENSDDLERLNRDTDKVEKDIYKVKTDLNVDMTLDHNAIKFVVNKLAEAFKNLNVENLPEATEEQKKQAIELSKSNPEEVEKLLKQINEATGEKPTLEQLVVMAGLGYTGDLGIIVYGISSNATDKEITQKFHEYKKEQYEASLVTLKTLDENLVGVQEVYSALNSFYNGDYSEVALSTLSVAAKKVPGGKQIIEKAEKTFNSLAGTQFSKNIKAYVKDIENITGIKITSNQKSLLNQNLKENKYTRLTVQETVKNRKDFNSKRTDLKKEWEQ